MDRELLIELGESAQERGNKCHAEAADQKHKMMMCSDPVSMFDLKKAYHSHLNDAFYWFGHANAYKGIAMLMEREEVGT